MPPVQVLRKKAKVTVNAVRDEMLGLTQKWIDGEIGDDSWEQIITDKVKQTHIIAALAANNNQDLSEEQKVTLADKIKSELGFLYGLKNEYTNDEIDDGALLTRIGMYADSAKTTFENEHRQNKIADDDPPRWERRILTPGATHCQQCIDYADMDWQEAGTLPAIGESCQCISNCQCRFEYSWEDEIPNAKEDEAEFSAWDVFSHVPDFRQQEDYDCGAAVTHIVAATFGVGPDSEDDYIRDLKTTERDGTEVSHIVDDLRSFGLSVEVRENMEYEDLEKIAYSLSPVIVAIQDFGKSEDEEEADNKDGHYVVVVKAEPDTVWVQDPSCGRIAMPASEFVKKWHDVGMSKDGKQETYIRLGIICTRQKAAPIEVDFNAAFSGTSEGVKKAWESRERAKDKPDPLGFYSRMQNAIDELGSKPIAAEAVKNRLKKSKEGISDEEWRESKMDEFLAGKKQVTKEELQQHFDDNRVKVDEIIKHEGGDPEVGKKLHELNVKLQNIENKLQQGSSSGDELEWNYQKALSAYQSAKKEDSDFEEKASRLATLGKARKERNNLFAERDIIQRQARELHDQQSENGAVFSSYKTSTGKNYKEMLLTLPDPIQEKLDELNEEYRKIRIGVPVNQTEFNTSSEPSIVEARNKLADVSLKINELNARHKTEGTFKGAHWNEPNVIAHVRMADQAGPNGEKLLHVEEVQSDWHQTGREQGYRPHDIDELKVKEKKLEKEIKEKQKPFWDFRDKFDKKYGTKTIPAPSQIVLAIRDDFDTNITDPFANMEKNFGIPKKESEKLFNDYDLLDNPKSEIGKMIHEKNLLTEKISKSTWQPPEGPFKDTWHDLAMKRVMHYAAEHGYDGVAVNHGEHINRVLNMGSIDADSLPGQKEFYDKSIPNWLNKYGKPHDSQVKQVEIPYGQGQFHDEDYEEDKRKSGVDKVNDFNGEKLYNGENMKVSVLPITESMRKQATEKGHAMFSGSFATIEHGKIIVDTSEWASFFGTSEGVKKAWERRQHAHPPEAKQKEGAATAAEAKARDEGKSGVIAFSKKAYHAVHELGSKTFHMLPNPAQFAISGTLALMFSAWTASQKLAERISIEKGSTPEEAAKTRDILAACDIGVFKPVSLSAMALHSANLIDEGTFKTVESSLWVVPPVTAGYLLANAGTHPVATIKAAVGLVKDAYAVSKQAIEQHTAHLSKGNPKELVNALENHEWDDWYNAILHAALQETKSDIDASIKIADEVFKAHPKDESTPTDHDIDDLFTGKYDNQQAKFSNCGKFATIEIDIAGLFK